MPQTEQQKALETVQRLFGKTGFTQHHVNYVRVGFHPSSKDTLSAVGNSWQEAIDSLREKVNEWAA